MMIVFDKEDWRFNYRVAGILIDSGRVLLEQEIDTGACCLPGGRVEFGESAGEAIVREIREELGVEAEVARLLWAVDNFFQLDGRRYHELSFYFLMLLSPDTVLPHGPGSFTNRGTDRTVLKWYTLDALNGVALKPDFLRSALKSLPAEAVYLVNRDAPLQGAS